MFSLPKLDKYSAMELFEAYQYIDKKKYPERTEEIRVRFKKLEGYSIDDALIDYERKPGRLDSEFSLWESDSSDSDGGDGGGGD